MPPGRLVDGDEAAAVTRAAYEAHLGEYLAADGAEPSDAARALARLVPGGRVLEVGSGPGRDARWLRTVGIDVQPSDVADSVLDHLRGQGLDPVRLDVRADDLPAGPWDGLLANAVLLHLTRAELPAALARLRAGVEPGIPLVASLKTGREDGWSAHKLGAPRWFTYWTEPDLRDVLTDAGWRVVECRAGGGRHDDWLLVVATAV